MGFMNQITHVVYVMMENRSLDNLLGWLYKDSSPKNFYPAGNKAPYNGLLPQQYYNPAYKWDDEIGTYYACPIPNWADSDRVPAYDPNEAMVEYGLCPLDDKHWVGVMNQLYGNQNTISAMPNKGEDSPMLGFLQDYYADYMTDWRGLDILWTYTPMSQAKNINALAYNFAVSDRWFCSVPTQTNPNRAFSLCGTSLGRERNASCTAVEQFDVPTLINKLAEPGGSTKGKTWGLYFEETWHKTRQDKEVCYTEYTFPRIAKAPRGKIAKLEQFYTDLNTKNLPEFTFIEPKWGYGKGEFYTQGNDYHPPTYIKNGDEFLLKVYQKIRDSSYWRDTLLIVTFDEHGGTYDHVAPPWTAVNPDGKHGTKYDFSFEQYGARVPTLLISPYIAPQTVFRKPEGHPHEFDHTSIIATLLRWAGVDNLAEAGLGKRVACAPTFEGVLSNSRVNATTRDPRSPPYVAVAQEEGGADSSAGASRATESLDDLFRGIPYTSARAIIVRSKCREDIEAGVRKYKQDPDYFAASLEAGELPHW